MSRPSTWPRTVFKASSMIAERCWPRGPVTRQWLDQARPPRIRSCNSSRTRTFDLDQRSGAVAVVGLSRLAMEKAIPRCRKLLLALVIMIAVPALRRRRQPIASRRSLCGLTVTSWSRTAAALLRRQFLGIGVAGCRRPGQFDERHDPPTGTVKLANDEALLLDVAQQTACTAQRM